MSNRPEEIAPGIYRIDALGVSSLISVLAVVQDKLWTLVDAGIGRSAKRLQRKLTSLGAEPILLETIYLTHHHSDHTGGVSDLLTWAPAAEVVAPAGEAEVITGVRRADPSSNVSLRAVQRVGKVPTLPVNRTVREGDVVAGFRVIDTPGHTLAHSSLLHEQHGLLFVGDAFGATPRRLRVGVRKAFCTDPAQAKRSAQKLLSYEYETVVFSHGPVWRDNAKARLAEVVASCGYS